jgi:hypothetical protein
MKKLKNKEEKYWVCLETCQKVNSEKIEFKTLPLEL